MRLSSRLCAQHLDWMFKQNWHVQGKLVAYDTGAANELAKYNIPIADVEDVVKQKFQKLQHHFDEHTLAVPEDELHEQQWHTYGNCNVILGGVPQTQVLTKTIEIEGFPKTIKDSINKMNLQSTIDRRIQQIIMGSHVFDAEQVKLPKVPVLTRPRVDPQREFGISHDRRNRLLINKLLSECEKLSAKAVSSQRRLFDNIDFRANVAHGDDLILFEVSAEKFISSTRPIEQVKEKFNGDLPDLYPLKHTISMPKENITIKRSSNFYPLNRATRYSHPHTLITFFDKEFVKHLHEVEVNNSQFQSRTILKAFTVAAARAKQLYGENAVGNLPKPIVVQSIQTDGSTFHFGVFQLNTLNLGGSDDTKNFWFHESNMQLFAECGYNMGRPYLEGYNKEVFRCLNAFYNNA